MARQYQPKHFFRNVPNSLLQAYFTRHGVLSDVDFGTLKETKVEPIYEAWLGLPENAQSGMERDFQGVDDLATEAGSKAILDEARFHGEDLAEVFSGFSGFHERAFWTFLERPDYWLGAAAFHRADTLPPSYWRKRKNLPQKTPDVAPETIRSFEENLGTYFHLNQGRGRNCTVECYKREHLHYFFAYPEDYARASIEWEMNELSRRPHHPAFEIIFVYSEKDGTLDIYLSGDRTPVPELQGIFAEKILKREMEPDEADQRVYDLAPLRARHFRFMYGPESGITDVTVKKLRLAVAGTDRVVLEANPAYNRHAVYDLLDQVSKGSPLPLARITQVGLKVVFAPGPSSRRPPTRTFDISAPNSCSLRHDARDLAIRKMLADSGIEPREPAAEEEAAS